mgnify:CR=1 FL=1
MISDYSWTLSKGPKDSLRIRAKPTTLVKSIEEVTSFLSLMEPGQALALKPRQDLLITGLSRDAMLSYYRLCQEKDDVSLRDKGQDELFQAACPTLALKNLMLKVYGVHAAQIDRSIDVNIGGILYKATKNDSGLEPQLILVLLKKPVS